MSRACWRMEYGRRQRPVTFAAAAPVDADHTDAVGKQRRGEFDSVLAGEIAVDEDDGDIASPHSRQPSWTSPARTLATIRLHLFRPAVGAALVGVGSRHSDAVSLGAALQSSR
jgi:hypothetical protein